MLFKEYLENLNKFAEQNPDALTYEVLSASDDEGNNYNLVHYSPTVGLWEEGEFTDISPEEECSPNSVVIN